MENFVISLKSASDRRAHIKDQFGNKNIPFQFFDAIEPSQIESQAEQIGFEIRRTDLSRNELACLLSHVSLWKKVVDKKIPAIAIFEDDIYLGENAELLLKDLSWLSVDIVKIEKISNTAILDLASLDIFDDEKFSLKKMLKPHLGAGGYIISQKAAIDLLDFLGRLIVLDHVDQILFNKYIYSGRLPIFQLNPVLCIQDCILNPDNQKFKTSLQWRNKNKVNYTLFDKIIRELRRVVRKIFEYRYKTKLLFVLKKNDL